MSEHNASPGDRLAAMRESYIASLPEKVTQIIILCKKLLEGKPEGRDVKELVFHLHRLSGSSGTYGLADVHEHASSLEKEIVRLLDGKVPEPETAGHISGMLRELAASVDIQVEQRQVAPSSRESATPAGTDRTDHDRKAVYLLETDAALASDIAQHLSFFNYETSVYPTAVEMEEAMRSRLPGVILANASFAKRGGCLEGEKCRYIPPTVYLSDSGTIETRLDAVRAGGDAFFTLPVDINELVDTLDNLNLNAVEDPYRVLVVEDDFEQAMYYALLLQQAGMQASFLTNPMKIMKPLVEFLPEIILMDIHMPECTGAELASVVRQQTAFVSVPIVFLSAEEDAGKKLRAMQTGGDDFINKNIAPDHLVTSVKIKVERYRVLRSFMERDSLTGLLKHSRIKEHLRNEVGRARRRGGELAFAMIDIDHFKRVNDTHGHLVGDRVLKGLSRLLQQRLRKTDIIGRYGGEEFAVIMLDTSGRDAVHILDGIRSSFARIRHHGDSGDFHVSFSAGIADFPRFGQAVEINEAADRALYAAKAGGRNRVIPAG